MVAAMPKGADSPEVKADRGPLAKTHGFQPRSINNFLLTILSEKGDPLGSPYLHAYLMGPY